MTMKGCVLGIVALAGSLAATAEVKVSPRVILDDATLMQTHVKIKEVAPLCSGWQVEGKACLRPFNRVPAGKVEFSTGFRMRNGDKVKVEFLDGGKKPIYSREYSGTGVVFAADKFLHDGSLKYLRLTPSEGMKLSDMHCGGASVRVNWAFFERERKVAPGVAWTISVDRPYLTDNFAVEFSAWFDKDTSFTIGGVDVNKLYSYYPGLWYRLRFEVNNGLARVKLNGRAIAKDIKWTGFDFVNRAIAELQLDDLKVYALENPEDYPPRPIVPKGQEKALVGMNICSLWRNGHHWGWNCVDRSGRSRPVLGYYDEGLPETADWEIKYFVEHGVDFQAFCWYGDSDDRPLRRPRLRYQLEDGFKNARYSDMMKYCLIWEIQNAGRPHTLENWKRNYAPYFIEHYFKDPRYLVLDGKPVLAVFGAWNFPTTKKGFGSVEKTREAFDWLREEVKKYGFRGVIYVSSNWNDCKQAEAMGFDVCVPYNYGKRGKFAAYNRERNEERLKSAAGTSVFTPPAVAVGFDNVPWGGDASGMLGISDFRDTMLWMRDVFGPKTWKTGTWQEHFHWICTWNEYGEGTYTMPTCDSRGFGYLNAIREVFTDDKLDPSLDLVPTERQLERITNLYPQSPTATDCAWEGESLSAWANCAKRHMTNVRCEDGVLKGTVNGMDPGFVLNLPAPLPTRLDHVFNVRIRTAVGGKIQMFWMTPKFKSPTGLRMGEDGVASNSEWTDCRLIMDWHREGETITGLRLDLPGGSDVPYDFEISSIRLSEESDIARQTLVTDLNASNYVGVAFSLQMPKGVHYCTIEWTREDCSHGWYYFTPATDGLKHDYWFNLNDARTRHKPKDRPWSGRIVRCRVLQRTCGRYLPAENLRFVKKAPDTRTDVSIVTAHPNEAIPRAGRPFPVEVLLRNYGTRTATNIVFAFDSLPPGVAPLKIAELTPREALRGSKGQDSICNQYRYNSKPLVNERRYVLTLPDLGVGQHRFGLTVRADGQGADRVPSRAEIVADVKPSLGLAKCDYPPEPKPVKTGKYEIGAIIFPGWIYHTWEPDWCRAPWRKPVLGWYDESNAETIDWQIKQMVENGISFVCVNWYWDRKLGHSHWPDEFARARYRKYLKWFVQWSNHNKPGSHSPEDQTNVVRYWIEHYFSDPQYMRIDGKPVVVIYAPWNMERDMKDKGGCRALMDLTRREVAAAGYPGVYLIGMRGPDAESRKFMQQFEDMGFDATTVYYYRGIGTPGVKMAANGSIPYKWVAESSYGHWKRVTENSRLPILPNLSTGTDQRVWLGEQTRTVVYGKTAADFAHICRSAKRYCDETGCRRLLVGPLDEWCEGEIGYPNQELGFGMFEAIRETFGEGDSADWPVNAAPEDLGLECPQLDLNTFFPHKL